MDWSHLAKTSLLSSVCMSVCPSYPSICSSVHHIILAVGTCIPCWRRKSFPRSWCYMGLHSPTPPPKLCSFRIPTTIMLSWHCLSVKWALYRRSLGIIWCYCFHFNFPHSMTYFLLTREFLSVCIVIGRHLYLATNNVEQLPKYVKLVLNVTRKNNRLQFVA